MKRQRKAAEPAAVAKADQPQVASRARSTDAIDAAIADLPHRTVANLTDHASPLSLAVHDGTDGSVLAAGRTSHNAPLPLPPKTRAGNRATAAKRPSRSPRLAEALSRPPISRPILPVAAAETLVEAQPAVQAERAPAAAVVPERRPEVAPRPDAQLASTAVEPTLRGAFAPDFDAATRTVGRLIEYSGKAAAAYLQPREAGDVEPSSGAEVSESLKTIGRIAESWLTNPARMIQAQAALTAQIMGVWGDTIARFSGGQAPTAPDVTPPRKTDRRFAAPEWRETPMFDFLHQAYLATTEWARAMVQDADGIDEATREKAAFYLRQVSSAVSPANFLATNPELIKETFRENGENLVRGMKMLAEDIEAGGGELKIRQSDASKFKLGVDMATTPGKVVFRNDLMELIQYAPATAAVLKRPLLIVPPWINKFYVLDLNRDKSFIGWAVSQGLTVFVISWVNPDERHAAKDWDAYMREGIVAALDAVEQAIGVRDAAAVGYCVGGTLLAATLAYMAQVGDGRISAATFLTTQVDFEDAGDLKVFADEAQIRVLEREMKKGGYLPGGRMATAFNMLRPDDLIWSYATNVYIKGQSPAAFDLLAWNSDSTRMTAANHAFYLRNCYLENRLAKGEMVIGGARVNLGAVTIPIYDLAAKEDHIAPARSVFNGARFFGGPVRYVMAGSGHIAGVVNPPSKAKYQFWSGGRMDGSFEDWMASAGETKGTWWPNWFEWLRAQSPETVEARKPGAGGLPALADAPGDYVRQQS